MWGACGEKERREKKVSRLHSLSCAVLNVIGYTHFLLILCQYFKQWHDVNVVLISRIIQTQRLRLWMPLGCISDLSKIKYPLGTVVQYCHVNMQWDVLFHYISLRSQTLLWHISFLFNISLEKVPERKIKMFLFLLVCVCLSPKLCLFFLVMFFLFFPLFF